MNKKVIILILLAVLLVALMGGASVLYDKLGGEVDAKQLATQQTTVPTGETAGQLPMAPDFTVYDRDGNPVRLADYIGKPVVLNCWASWCGPCQMEMPDFEEKFKELGEDIQFLMVNMTDGSRETVDIAAGFIAEEGYTFPVFYDTDQNVAITYGVYSLPTTFFIDAQGHAIAQATGAIDSATLQKGIDMIS